MSKPSVVVRAKEAWRYFRKGYPAGRKATRRTKVHNLQPTWRMADIESYVREGFNLNSLIYSAIMFKARAVITAPLRAYSGDPNYPELLKESHPLAKLVARPNEHQSWAEFQSLNVVYLNIAGETYSYKDRERSHLVPLRPDRVFIVPTKPDRMGIRGVDYYLYVPKGKSYADGYPIIPEDMIQIKFPNPSDPLSGAGYGHSPIGSLAQSADVDNMVTEFLNLFFKRGAMLTSVLSFDVPLTEDLADTIIERWEAKYGGHKKWGTGVLDRGATYNRVGLTFEEMGFGELDARSECRILGPFGVPPILIGSRVGLEHSTYSNYEGARKAVWEDTLVPELMLFQAEYQYHLKMADAFVQFDLSQVPALQKDLPPIVSAAYTLWQMGVPANQALAAVGLRVGEVPEGDLPYAGAPPPGMGSGQEQGPRVDGEDDAWGMRGMQ